MTPEETLARLALAGCPRRMRVVGDALLIDTQREGDPRSIQHWASKAGFFSSAWELRSDVRFYVLSKGRDEWVDYCPTPGTYYNRMIRVDNPAWDAVAKEWAE